MSKMDDLRAMREARYEQAMARAAKATPATKEADPAPRRPTVAPAAPAPVSVEPEPDAGLCGHRAMSGRTCTREPGHAEKSHRYAT